MQGSVFPFVQKGYTFNEEELFCSSING